nr:hypothetical protein CFP56_51998 [Quercus suber]
MRLRNNLTISLTVLFSRLSDYRLFLLAYLTDLLILAKICHLIFQAFSNLVSILKTSHRSMHNMDTHCILVVVTLLALKGMFVKLLKMWDWA